MDNETREDRIRRLAYNRWEMRQHYQYRSDETDKDDWTYAEILARREEEKRLM